MASLTDIKAQLDGLQSDDQKLIAFATSTQSSLASVQAQLDAAKAAGADPATMDAISAEIATMQQNVEAALPAAAAQPSTAAAGGTTTGSTVPDPNAPAAAATVSGATTG